MSSAAHQLTVANVQLTWDFLAVAPLIQSVKNVIGANKGQTSRCMCSQ